MGARFIESYQRIRSERRHLCLRFAGLLSVSCKSKSAGTAAREPPTRMSALPLVKQFGTHPVPARANSKIFPEDLEMSRKKLTLVISLIVSVAAIAGGIVYAQEATTPQAEAFQALVDADLQEPQQPNERSFSFFVGSGAYLGVAAEDISKENMARYGMREVRGVGVTEILKDSPAEKAGLKKDDVILSFDGESVR